MRSWIWRCHINYFFSSISLSNLCCLWLCFFDIMPSIPFSLNRCIYFLMLWSWWFVIFLICWTKYPSSLSKIILALYPDSACRSIICKRFFSSIVSILRRKISLIVLVKRGKLNALQYLNKHHYFTVKYSI